MLWDEYNSVNQAMKYIPNGRIQNADHAIPDVYSKALHLYFALHASDEASHEKEINLWRGLLTLIALQNYLNFPLSWQQVSLPEHGQGTRENLLDAALRHPPEVAKHILSTDLRQTWNGRDFYVLKWTDKNGKELDLLLYSPATLVYPVADWKKIFSHLENIKWFDLKEKCFLGPENVLDDQEKRIVHVWLKDMSNYFNLPAANEAQRTIKRHLDRYITDLDVVLSAKDKASQFYFVEIRDEGIDRRGLFEKLRMSVKATLPKNGFLADEKPIEANRIFADQICYFRMEEKNPFANCRYSENYKIHSIDGFYAFLPVRSEFREYFSKNDLARNITMTWIKSNRTPTIHVELMISGKRYEHDYKVTEKADATPDIAVPFIDGMTDEKTMPLVSVWPGKIGETWKKYYIMLDGSRCASGDLRVADSSETEKSSNNYVVQTSYVPDAIPIVKRLRNNGGEVSIGMITPKLEPPREKPAYLSADVAVDFGTSSTRVFAKIDQEIEEINISADAPLLVTVCDLLREKLMRDYFIAPSSFTRGSDALFSVYRRSDYPRSEIQPVLDGVIYQPGEISVVEFVENCSTLMSDLKWTVSTNRSYYSAFMQQLFLHITSLLYEKGVNSIKWEYALPKNMDHDVKEIIRNIWANNIDQYISSFTDKISFKIGSVLSESEAASRYFLFNRINTIHAKKGYLVVDIGGGSTDIALWQGEPQNVHMKWHSSVNVAGRKMFTCWIEKYIEQLCERTQNENLTAHLDMINQTTPALRLTLIEMLLNSNYDILLENYQQECLENSSGWGMELRKEINMSISFLMFVLGYQIGMMILSKNFDVPDGLGAFTIAFGGRGSKILEWRGYERDLLIDIFRAGIFASGIQKTFEIEIEVSSSPKCEVAQGLLVNRSPEAISIKPDNIHIDIANYIDAAKAFQEAFNTTFQGPKTNGRHLSDSRRINRNSLAAQIEKEKNSEIVKVFMEAIFDIFNSSEE